jgi:hypothetical protein
VIRDGGVGLLAALPAAYPGVPVKRCRAYKISNVLDEGASRQICTPSPTPLRCRERGIDDSPLRRPLRANYTRLACLRDDLDELLTWR